MNRVKKKCLEEAAILFFAEQWVEDLHESGRVRLDATVIRLISGGN